MTTETANEVKSADARARTQYAADRHTLLAMRRAIRDHLTAAMNECADLAKTLERIDADQVMVDIRHNFCPLEDGAIQDSFNDAFYAAAAEIYENGVEYLWDGNQLNSGAARE